MTTLFTDLEGNPIHDDEVFGYGASGVVLLQDGLAIKTPLRFNWSTEEEVEANIEAIKREQRVYRRLDNCDGVVPCLGLTETSIKLAYMENGELHKYLEQNSGLSRAFQLSLFREMARTLANIHNRHVLVTDISSRNFLLASDFSVKLCDFTEAYVLPRVLDMETTCYEGFSVQTDIGELGTVFYEIITGQRVKLDVYQDFDPINTRANFPHRDTLPSTEGLRLGNILEKCWEDGGFRNARCLLAALDEVDIRHPPPAKIETNNFSLQRNIYRLSQVFKTLDSPVTVLSVVFGALTLPTAWLRRRYRI